MKITVTVQTRFGDHVMESTDLKLGHSVPAVPGGRALDDEALNTFYDECTAIKLQDVSNDEISAVMSFLMGHNYAKHLQLLTIETIGKCGIQVSTAEAIAKFSNTTYTRPQELTINDVSKTVKDLLLASSVATPIGESLAGSAAMRP